MSEAPPDKSAASYSATPGTHPEKNSDEESSLQTAVVDFDDQYPHPNQWPIARRWAIIVLITILNMLVGVGMVSDLFPVEQRGQGLAVLNMAFILATPIGAIVGGFTSYSASWRYDFYATSAVAGVLIVISAFVFRETYPPVILGRRKKQLVKNDPKALYDDEQRTLAALYTKTIIRPIEFLTTQPIVMLLSLYAAIIYGTTYLIFSTFPTLWERHYEEPKNLASLHFIAPGIGYFIGIQIGMFSADRIYLALKRRNQNEGRPEFRLPLLAISAVCVPPALFWYGWTAEAKLHWAVPNVAIVVLMCGCTLVFQCVMAYFIDTFPLYGASAMAASYLARGLCAFGFPLFGPSMYERLGYGWGNSLLGFLALAVAVPVPLVLWFYGERLRRVSSYTM
ncbi:hypothetical protein APSETT444_009821 [Aspergillus pseudonomiae]